MMVIFTIWIIYALLICGFVLGNYRLKSTGLVEFPKTKVSVLVAFKDEEENIVEIAKCLMNQEYPTDLIEFIFVNDNSEDKGRSMIEVFAEQSLMKVKILDLKNGIGKKSALDFGIKNAKGEFIITTDADCKMSPKWVLSLVSEFEETKASFIAGPVGLDSNDSIFGNLIQLEFSALIASTSGGFGINKPFMCNGANLGFTRKVYDELSPYESNIENASGDDVFFLHQVKRRQYKLSFVNSKLSLVKTKGAGNIMEFLNQRIRWAGKSSSYKDTDTILFGIIIVLVNIGLLVSLYCLFIGFISIGSMLSLFAIKVVLDTVLIYSAKPWILTKNIIFNSLLLSFIYPFYSVGIALLSLIFKPKWKGRKI